MSAPDETLNPPKKHDAGQTGGMQGHLQAGVAMTGQ